MSTSSSNLPADSGLSDSDINKLVTEHDASLPAQPMPNVKDGDPREGFFVNIDLSAKGVKQAYKDAGLEDEAGKGAGSYGVWYSTTSDGNAFVRLRDATNAYVVLPIASLSSGESGGR